MNTSTSNELPDVNHPHIKEQIKLAYEAGKKRIEADWYRAEHLEALVSPNFTWPNYETFEQYFNQTYGNDNKVSE